MQISAAEQLHAHTQELVRDFLQDPGPVPRPEGVAMPEPAERFRNISRWLGPLLDSPKHGPSTTPKLPVVAKTEIMGPTTLYFAVTDPGKPNEYIRAYWLFGRPHRGVLLHAGIQLVAPDVTEAISLPLLDSDQPTALALLNGAEHSAAAYEAASAALSPAERGRLRIPENIPPLIPLDVQ